LAAEDTQSRKPYRKLFVGFKLEARNEGRRKNAKTGSQKLEARGQRSEVGSQTSGLRHPASAFPGRFQAIPADSRGRGRLKAEGRMQKSEVRCRKSEVGSGVHEDPADGGCALPCHSSILFRPFGTREGRLRFLRLLLFNCHSNPFQAVPGEGGAWKGRRKNAELRSRANQSSSGQIRARNFFTKSGKRSGLGPGGRQQVSPDPASGVRHLTGACHSSLVTPFTFCRESRPPNK
jgi:hypothetical protein